MAALVLGLALLSAAPAAAAARDPLPDAIRREAARIRWTAALTERLIREMPKVETHVHLDGTLTSGLIQELANAQGLPPFAGKSLEEIRRVAVVDSPRGSLQQVLDAFATFLPLLKRPEAVERVAHEVVKSAPGRTSGTSRCASRPCSTRREASRWTTCSRRRCAGSSAAAGSGASRPA
jgi:hypothetical protein